MPKTLASCLASSQTKGAREESSHHLTLTLSWEEREPLWFLSLRERPGEGMKCRLPLRLVSSANFRDATLEEKAESKSKSDRSIIYVESRAWNQKDERVLPLRRCVLMPKRPT